MSAETHVQEAKGEKRTCLICLLSLLPDLMRLGACASSLLWTLVLSDFAVCVGQTPLTIAVTNGQSTVLAPRG